MANTLYFTRRATGYLTLQMGPELLPSFPPRNTRNVWLYEYKPPKNLRI